MSKETGGAITVRLHSLCSQFRQARESKGVTIKEVSAKLKVPQYRLKAVESGSTSAFDPSVFAKYSDFLELTPWVRQWNGSNPELAEKLGIWTGEV